MPFARKNDWLSNRAKRLTNLLQDVIQRKRLPEYIEHAIYQDTSLTDREQEWWLFVYFHTASNWDEWVYQNVPRCGLKRTMFALESEYLDTRPFEHMRTDPNFYTLPLFLDGEDWRTPMLLSDEAEGPLEDTIPLDVVWTTAAIARAAHYWSVHEEGR